MLLTSFPARFKGPYIRDMRFAVLLYFGVLVAVLTKFIVVASRAKARITAHFIMVC
jgi:hypothetical protein